jgi:very-short-patch-repair endonuclease
MDVAAVVAQEGRRTQGLVTARQLRAAGVARSSLARALADGSVHRVRRLVYACQPLEPLPRFVVTDTGVSPAYVAHVRASLLSLGSSATACLRTAAALHGWGLLIEPARTVQVAVPHGRGSVRAGGVVATQRRSARTEELAVLADAGPLSITTPVQTVLDCAVGLPLLEAVVVCDSALRSGRLTVEELVGAGGGLRGVRDAGRVQRVLDLCDPQAGSVLESVLRVRMRQHGITGVTSQKVVQDMPGSHMRVDFCFEAAGVVVEADGKRWHPEPERDRLRDNVLASQGWRVLRYTWSEVVHDHRFVVAEIAAALACGTPTLHLAGTGACDTAA